MCIDSQALCATCSRLLKGAFYDSDPAMVPRAKTSHCFGTRNAAFTDSSPGGLPGTCPEPWRHERRDVERRLYAPYLDTLRLADPSRSEEVRELPLREEDMSCGWANADRRAARKEELLRWPPFNSQIHHPYTVCVCACVSVTVCASLRLRVQGCGTSTWV